MKTRSVCALSKISSKMLSLLLKKKRIQASSLEFLLYIIFHNARFTIFISILYKTTGVSIWLLYDSHSTQSRQCLVASIHTIQVPAIRIIPQLEWAHRKAEWLPKQKYQAQWSPVSQMAKIREKNDDLSRFPEINCRVWQRRPHGISAMQCRVVYVVFLETYHRGNVSCNEGRLRWHFSLSVEQGRRITFRVTGRNSVWSRTLSSE
jgi:hypothetical protein